MRKEKREKRMRSEKDQGHAKPREYQSGGSLGRIGKERHGTNLEEVREFINIIPPILAEFRI